MTIFRECLDQQRNTVRALRELHGMHHGETLLALIFRGTLKALCHEFRQMNAVLKDFTGNNEFSGQAGTLFSTYLEEEYRLLSPVLTEMKSQMAPHADHLHIYRMYHIYKQFLTALLLELSVLQAQISDDEIDLFWQLFRLQLMSGYPADKYTY